MLLGGGGHRWFLVFGIISTTGYRVYVGGRIPIGFYSHRGRQLNDQGFALLNKGSFLGVLVVRGLRALRVACCTLTAFFTVITKAFFDKGTHNKGL